MIETNRLKLRVATLQDAPDMLKLNADPEVVRFTGDVPLRNLMEAEQLIRERMLPQWTNYKMGRFTTFLKDGTFIGSCGLRTFAQNNEVDLGFRFMKKFWGNGYATEASKACLDYGFHQLNLERIIAKAIPDNLGSIKVLQNLKMTFKGFSHDPSDPMPFVVYELLKKDFPL